VAGPERGTSLADPVVAWAVYSDGDARAIDTDADADAVLLSLIAKHRRTYHPGQIPETPLPDEQAPGAAAEGR